MDFGGLPVFPELARVLGDFFTPAFERMAPPTEVRGHFVIVGDSSLALCEHQSRRATYKTTFEAPLSQAVQIDPRISSTHVRMLWGKGLHEIANVIGELLTERPEVKYPDGLDIMGRERCLRSIRLPGLYMASLSERGTNVPANQRPSPLARKAKGQGSAVAGQDYRRCSARLRELHHLRRRPRELLDVYAPEGL